MVNLWGTDFTMHIEKMVWTRKKERRRLRGEKDDGDGRARKKEKKKAKEKVDGFVERRHGKGWS